MLEYKFILSGAFVGFMTGLTGIGGGSLMTPILVLILGFSPNTAVATDLLFAAFTKTMSVYSFAKQKRINWKIVFLLACGSIPSACLTLLFLRLGHFDTHAKNIFMQKAIGIAIICSVVFYLCADVMKKYTSCHFFFDKLKLNIKKTGLVVVLGAFIGCIVIVLYRELPPVSIIATELAHAFPLALIAGLIYGLTGHINLHLLTCLLIGSLPAAYIGSALAGKMPQKLIVTLLLILLVSMSIKMLL
jgi:uncharacterized membrane protein YfcA